MNHLAPVSITASGGMGGGVHARQGALVLPSSALDDVAGRTALHASELATLQTLAGETMLMGEAVTQQQRKMLNHHVAITSMVPALSRCPDRVLCLCC